MGRNKYDPVDNWVHTQLSKLSPKVPDGGPTAQQKALEAQQATIVANLNLEENSQRKAMLNAMQGTRVFRGSALSRAMAGSADAGIPAGAPSGTQTRSGLNRSIINASQSLLDSAAPGGSTPSGGAGASGGGGTVIGGRSGGGGSRSGVRLA